MNRCDGVSGFQWLTQCYGIGKDRQRGPFVSFRLKFSQPVPSPLSLGHSSHFGLGLFVPEMESNPDRSGAIPKTIIDKE